MSNKRRKGVAIVDTVKGILVVSGKSKKFILPGGGAEKWESRKRATIRELHEETGLRTRKINYLFKYVGDKWQAHNGKTLQNHTKVFLVKAEGIPRPRHEIKHFSHWRNGMDLNLTSGAKKVIETYLSKYKSTTV